MPLIYVFSNDNAFTHLKCKNYSHQAPKHATAYLHKLKIKKYEGEKIKKQTKESREVCHVTFLIY